MHEPIKLLYVTTVHGTYVLQNLERSTYGTGYAANFISCHTIFSIILKVMRAVQLDSARQLLDRVKRKG